MSRLARRTFLRRSTALVLGPALPAFAGSDRAEVTPIDERLRLGATNAPLAMQFRGTTAEDARRWQAGFAETLRMLLGPARRARRVGLGARADRHSRRPRPRGTAADGRRSRPGALPPFAPPPPHAGSPRPPARRTGDPRPRRLRPRRDRRARRHARVPCGGCRGCTTTMVSSSSASATWWLLLA